MSRNAPQGQAASVRQRLLNRSRERSEDFQVLLGRYALERFLHRLSRSRHRDRFVLKGALLFMLWEGDLHRMTRDFDLLGYGSHAVADLIAVVREVCQVEVEDDGLAFRTDQIRGGAIREDHLYEGVRVVVPGYLSTARVRLQIDVGFGDAVTPGPEEAAFPTILDSPAPTLQTYPKETVIAEKLQAMVTLGIVNSRMKDFYDVAHLAERFAFDGSLLVQAIRATFERRGTELPDRTPVALTEAFGADPAKRTQWQAFLRKASLEANRDLEEIVEVLRAFLQPPLEAAATGEAFGRAWTPSGPWR